MAERRYRIRSSVAGPGHRRVYRLTVPPDIATVIPDNTEFAVELTEDGLLYRPVEGDPERELPSWAKRRRSK
jgi:hypothetical protein